MLTPPAKTPAPGGRQPHGEDSAWRLRPATVREPWLIGAVVAVRAPAVTVVRDDGQIRPDDGRGFSSAFGYYDQDRRILSRAELTVDGVEPEWLRNEPVGATASRHVCAVRTPDDPTPDPVLIVERLHRAGEGEQITLRGYHIAPRQLTVELRIAADLADVSEVRRGQPLDHAQIERWRDEHEPATLRWRDTADGTTARLRLEPRPAAIDFEDGSTARVTWQVCLEPGRPWHAELALATEQTAAAPHPLHAADVAYPWTNPTAATDDKRLAALVTRGLEDLHALLLTLAEEPGSVFAAAGAPWYLTLFGRDSLWTARFLLPIDRDCRLAYGTLKALASLQGAKHDPATDEEHGKILHELRRGTTEHQQGEVLPPVYYGSMDATPLFVLLLVEAFRANPEYEGVAELIPSARMALDWMRRQTEADSAGFLRYRASREGGLFNQGWKDSADAVISFDGLQAEGSIALCEVQAYAIQAANGFAELLDAFPAVAQPGEAQRLRDWAASLRDRFLTRFQVAESADTSYFAMALDGNNKIVDGLTSNIGHLLGTGVLDHRQSAQLARLLVSDELFSGCGLRTRSSRHARYNPLSYHGGAVWAHDTAIAIRGLSIAARDADKAGEPDSARDCASAAKTLAEGLLSVAERFGYRLPELFSGDGHDAVPFPAACRPQAWSAAAGIVVRSALEQMKQLSLLTP